MCPKNVEEAEKSFRILKATKTNENNDHHVYLLVNHPKYGEFLKKLEPVEFNSSFPKYLPKITTNYPKKYENSFLNSVSVVFLVRNLWLGQVEGSDSISIVTVCSSIFTSLNTFFQLRVNSMRRNLSWWERLQRIRFQPSGKCQGTILIRTMIQRRHDELSILNHMQVKMAEAVISLFIINDWTIIKDGKVRLTENDNFLIFTY